MAAHNVHVTVGEFKDNMLPLSNWKTQTTETSRQNEKEIDHGMRNAIFGSLWPEQ